MQTIESKPSEAKNHIDNTLKQVNHKAVTSLTGTVGAITEMLEAGSKDANYKADDEAITADRN
jgi:hypothetical protein